MSEGHAQEHTLGHARDASQSQPATGQSASHQSATGAGTRPAISIDPETGRKIFNTRAAKASEKIAGKGYSVNTDEQAKELFRDGWDEQKPYLRVVPQPGR